MSPNNRPVMFIFAWALFTALASCDRLPSPEPPSRTAARSFSWSSETLDTSDHNWPRPRSNERSDERTRMVRTIQHIYDLTDPNILTALANVPRHWFVPASQQLYAYLDSPLPIGNQQTISQPYIVAYMTHILRLTPQMNVLEIGTGSGYQAAILNEFTPHVYTVEIIEPLARQASERFNEHGYKAITAKTGDGYKGWPEFAPFDAVIVTCAPDRIPQPLIDQLKPNGKMIIPVGDTRSIQHLVLVTKKPDASVTRKNLMPVRFVPMLRNKDPQ